MSKSRKMAEDLADNLMMALPVVNKSAGTRDAIIAAYEPLLSRMNKLIKSTDERIAQHKERWAAFQLPQEPVISDRELRQRADSLVSRRMNGHSHIEDFVPGEWT